MSDALMLVLDRRDTQVTLDGAALRVVRPEEKPSYVPLGLLDLVVIHGRALVTCDVWRALAERKIAAILLPGRGHGAVACVGASLGGGIALRSAQHRAAEQPNARMEISCRLISEKVRAYLVVALALPSGPEHRAVTADLIAHLQQLMPRIEAATDRAALMGLEGRAAVLWFQWIAHRLPVCWGFNARNRRPPRDPVNALLSLGYTLLGADMLNAIQAQGLDPARGLLHETVPGRDALVLDLIEPLRPSVDLVILGLLDDSLHPEDFTHSPSEGCRLSKSARARFYQAWARARKDWPVLNSSMITKEPSEPQAVSLQQHCRRQVDSLRAQLKPIMTDPLQQENTI